MLHRRMPGPPRQRLSRARAMSVTVPTIPAMLSHDWQSRATIGRCGLCSCHDTSRLLEQDHSSLPRHVPASADRVSAPLCGEPSTHTTDKRPEPVNASAEQRLALRVSDLVNIRGDKFSVGRWTKTSRRLSAVPVMTPARYPPFGEPPTGADRPYYLGLSQTSWVISDTGQTTWRECRSPTARPQRN
jgi:hypothetical protein